MNEISIFDFEQLSIRSLLIEDKPYFVGKDIAVALGYSDTAKAIKQHCKGWAKRPLPSASGEQEYTIIPESDLYRLIFNSKLPAAEKFEAWVTETVDLFSYRRNNSQKKNVIILVLQKLQSLKLSEI